MSTLSSNTNNINERNKSSEINEPAMAEVVNTTHHNKKFLVIKIKI